MKESDYGNLIPIVPVSEEPELTQYDKPYIVYGFAGDPTQTGNYRQRGTLTLVVRSTNFQEITTILNILNHTFNRQDEAARDINEYTETVAQFVGIRFGTTSVAFVEGPEPEEREGGRESGLISIRFDYFVNYSVKTNKSQWA